jgi:hypothetical protein
MAIVQISRITNRKGLTENLPQLAGAELGWCIDSRRLFIGNGTLESGAPVIGNTEILTEYSDITVLSTYTYADIAVGYAAQTGPTSSDPVVRTVQAKLDDFADVRDFGAVGDGIADDTEALNRALFQLYCRETNTQIRRTLYFPAGTYRITESLLIPTYAKLMGEGANCTTILLDTSSDISTLSAYVARYADSLQQFGASIGANGATPPRNIEISSMTFESVETTDIFLVENAQQCWFDSVNFVGPLTSQDIINDGVVDNIAGVRFSSTPAITCNQITFDKCAFQNLTFGINTSADLESVTVSNSKFGTLYNAVKLGGSGTIGVRVVHNIFDNIYAEGLVFTGANQNVSAYNLFLNVGQDIDAGTPQSPIIRMDDSNLSVGDMFERTTLESLTEPFIQVSASTGSDSQSGLQLGKLSVSNGITDTILDNVTDQAIVSVNALDVRAFTMTYTIVRSTDIRRGNITVVTGPSDDSTSDTSYTDDFVENSDTGVTLTVAKSSNIITVNYTTTNTGTAGTITYSITNLA